MFTSLCGKRALIVGGGKIASRRARALTDFGASVTVVSPEISDDMIALSDLIDWKKGRYSEIGGDFTLVIAATGDRSVNSRVGGDAKRVGIPVSVADSRAESTFWFPAIARRGGIVCGIVSEDGDHRAVREAAARIRKELEGHI